MPMSHGVHLSKDMCPKTQEEREHMDRIPYASAIGSIMYAMLCTRPDVSHALSITSRYQAVLVRNIRWQSRISLSTYKELRICS